MSAKVGRQADEFVEIVSSSSARATDPDAMVIQMGNNGPLYGDDMEGSRRRRRTSASSS